MKSLIPQVSIQNARLKEFIADDVIAFEMLDEIKEKIFGCYSPLYTFYEYVTSVTWKKRELFSTRIQIKLYISLARITSDNKS